MPPPVVPVPVSLATVTRPVLVPEVPEPVVPPPVVPVPVSLATVTRPVLAPEVPVPVVPVPVVPVPVLSVPVVPVPVLEEPVCITEEAAAEPVSVPSVELLEPLPRGTRSRRSGSPKVLEPSPVP